MNATVIILLIIGIIAIVVSFVLTPDKQEEEVNPNIPTELSEADKKHLNKLVDNHTKEYSKNKVKEIVSGTMKETIEAEIGKSDKQIQEKLAAHIGTIDERATEDTQKLEQYYNEVTADINSNKAELEELLKKVSDKEKEVKKSLTVIDEYKEGLDKLKAEITQLDAQVSAKRDEVEKGTIAPQKPVSVSDAVEQIPFNAEGETEVLKGPVINASDLEVKEDAKESANVEAEEKNESKGFGKGKKKRDKKNKKNKNANNSSNESSNVSLKKEAENAEAGNTEEATEAAAEASDARNNSNNSSVETPDLDEMLSAEGISLTEGDTVGNIMEMFNAGFSIIEISKVLGIGVGEIKAIIDKQQGE